MNQCTEKLLFVSLLKPLKLSLSSGWLNVKTGCALRRFCKNNHVSLLGLFWVSLWSEKTFDGWSEKFCTVVTQKLTSTSCIVHWQDGSLLDSTGVRSQTEMFVKMDDPILYDRTHWSKVPGLFDRKVSDPIRSQSCVTPVLCLPACLIQRFGHRNSWSKVLVYFKSNTHNSCLSNPVIGKCIGVSLNSA